MMLPTWLSPNWPMSMVVKPSGGGAPRTRPRRCLPPLRPPRFPCDTHRPLAEPRRAFLSAHAGMRAPPCRFERTRPGGERHESAGPGRAGAPRSGPAAMPAINPNAIPQDSFFKIPLSPLPSSLCAMKYGKGLYSISAVAAKMVCAAIAENTRAPRAPASHFF